MPRDRRAKRRSPGAGLFGGLLDEVLGSGVQYVAGVVKERAPKCNLCGTTTILRCWSCGKFVCNVHGFVNARSWDQVTCVCSECMSKHFDFIEIAPPPHWPADDMEWPHEERPHEILGIHWYSTEEQINAAYKELAKTAHPDHGGSPEEMSRLNAARDFMLRRLKGQR
jgi:hypothetical protein